MLASEEPETDSRPPVRELSKPQRRVLGALVEKGFTTPEYYPLTLKATTTACNQKSNRDPVTNYSEESVEETLDELRQLGLAAVVHTESGRTERYRHFVRHRYPFSESQLAVITELLLRGRQQLGELRTRASRMVPIDSLEQLREDLQALIDQGYVRANGPLERRGVEVDHNLYPAQERAGPEEWSAPSEPDEQDESGVSESAARASRASGSELAGLQETCRQLRTAVAHLTQELEVLKEQLAEVNIDVSRLKRDLGG
jgi:hypothetical protein